MLKYLFTNNFISFLKSQKQVHLYFAHSFFNFSQSTLFPQHRKLSPVNPLLLQLCSHPFKGIFTTAISMSTFRYSSPGKIILFGEHAVVYGHPAIAAAVSARTFMSCDFRRTLSTSINLTDNGAHTSFDPRAGAPAAAAPRERMLYDAFRGFPANHTLDIDIRSEFPTGMGMGSSASFCSLIAAAALRTAAAAPPTRDALFGETRRLEDFFHHRGSGLDPAAVVYGGVVKMDGGRIARAGGGGCLPLLIVDSGVPRSTRRSVQHVAALVRESGPVYAPILSALGGIARRFFDAGRSEQRALVQRYFPLAQRLLECLDLSTPEIDRIVARARENGLCAKISGAGMGGIVLVSGESVRGKEGLFAPFGVIPAELGAEGIREE